MTKTVGSVSAVVAMAVAALIVIVAINATLPNSTQGVRTVSDYEATIAQGDTLILTTSTGKTTTYWHVTFDGDSTVTVTDEGFIFPQRYSGTTCGEGCSLDLGMGFLRHITVTALPGGRVSVKWPWGWGYRRY